MNENTAAWLKSMGVENTCTDYHDILNDPEIQAETEKALDEE